MSETIRIKIDGKDITTFSGRNLVDVAKENGIFIPTLCYFRDIHPLGTCRICTVKLNGRHTTAARQRSRTGWSSR
ncbi:MAG: (2Fe-2S)-binding protein [Acidobacteria bacterium]|nr:(2Fe-2S)-binding protein [Acidobacteriota bacterium]